MIEHLKTPLNSNVFDVKRKFEKHPRHTHTHLFFNHLNSSKTSNAKLFVFFAASSLSQRIISTISLVVIKINVKSYHKSFHSFMWMTQRTRFEVLKHKKHFKAGYQVISCSCFFFSFALWSCIGLHLVCSSVKWKYDLEQECGWRREREKWGWTTTIEVH